MGESGGGGGREAYLLLCTTSFALGGVCRPMEKYLLFIIF